MRRTITSALTGVGLMLAADPALAAAHYKIAAKVDPAGTLAAETVIDLPPEEARQRNEFLLGRRFKVDAVDAGPGASVTFEPTDKPIGGLQKVVVTYPEAPKTPVKLRFRYGGPLNQEKDTAPAVTPGSVELRLETFWVPVRSDISLLYSVDAAIDGLPRDLTLVGQGETRRDGELIRIRRDLPDVDTPLVAVAGLGETATPGMEFYGPTGPDPQVAIFREHAVGAAKFLQDWLGPIPNGPTRIAVIPRVGGSSYARRGYIVISRPSAGDPDKSGEVANARHVAHEFAHAWFLAADPTTEHYWLTESLADYCAVRYAEARMGAAARDQLLDAKRERAKTAGPILGGVRPTRAALYDKGPLLLFGLEARIGRKAMDEVFVRLAKKPPRTTPEFMAVLKDVAGEAAARQFETELRT